MIQLNNAEEGLGVYTFNNVISNQISSKEEIKVLCDLRTLTSRSVFRNDPKQVDKLTTLRFLRK